MVAHVSSQRSVGVGGNGMSSVAWLTGGALNQEANARLIAAAPDMLAALERIADPSNYGSDGGWDAASYPDEIARAAIAKARGGQ
jgi:hypothetical protein